MLTQPLNYQNLFVKLILFLTIASLPAETKAQKVYHHIQNESVYHYLDEMAGMGLIEISSTIKPFTRTFIANQLKHIEENKEKLNPRQKQDLHFFLKDFNKELKRGEQFKKRKDLFYYSDSSFTISVNPILGFRSFNHHQDQIFHRWNGAEAFAYFGDRIGAYASLRDNHESRMISLEPYLNQRTGGNYKYVDNGGDYSEMRGGITFTWDWGHAGLVKDHIEWGSNNNGANIFSPKPPSFTHFKLSINPVEWFRFNYFHGWLISEIVDSTRSYQFTNAYGTSSRDVLRRKYISANMFSFRPFTRTWVSAGNSIIFGDAWYPGYAIPFLFYKSVDHTLNATDKAGNNVGQNSQMFFNLSSRAINQLHLYASVFIDELAISRFTKPDEYNFVSYKTGFRVYNLLPNTYFTGEWTRTNPLVYRHHIPITTFSSNGYNLGHYLKDNAEEYYFDVGFRPFRGMHIELSYNYARHGEDHTALGTKRVGIPFMEEVIWRKKAYVLDLSYEIIHQAFVTLTYKNQQFSGDVKTFTAPFFSEAEHLFIAGLNVGF